MFKAIACLTQLVATHVGLEHLQTPTQAGGKAQSPVVIKPALIQITGRHAGRDAD